MERRSVDIIIPYAPRPLQRQVHDNNKRFNVLVCHRRFGKTVLAVNRLIKSAVNCSHPNPRVSYIAPLFAQAKTIAWDYAKYYTAPIPGIKFNESELRIDFPNSARFSLYGADSPDRLRGLYHDDCVLDEYADMSPRIWSEVIRPALSDRNGSATFIGTPKGRNQFWEVYDAATRNPEWYTALFRASETNIISLGELEAARKDMSEEQYAQEFECSFQAALIGAYYGKEIAAIENKGRVTGVPHDPAMKVYTAWDLGMDDATAIWFVQVNGPEIRLIDYYENSGCGLDHYATVLRQKSYVYADHYLPHDVKVSELGTGRSRLETLAGLGINATPLEASGIEDGINASRLILGRAWFDIENTKRGLESLRQYQREWDDKNKTFRNKPRHDWTSHAADAFRYLAMGLPGARGTPHKEPLFRFSTRQQSETSWMAG